MQKLNITKEEFLKILNDYRTQKEKTEKFSKAIEDMCSGYVVFDSENKYLEALIFTLSKLFHQTPNEYSNTIEWYLFEYVGEDNEHCMFYNGYELNVNTDELFWELLCAEFEQNANNNDTVMKELFKSKGIAITQEEYHKKHNIHSVNLVKTMSYDEVMDVAKENYLKRLKNGD